MLVIAQQMALLDPTLFLLRQPTEHLPKVPTQLLIQQMSNFYCLPAEPGGLSW